MLDFRTLTAACFAVVVASECLAQSTEAKIVGAFQEACIGKKDNFVSMRLAPPLSGGVDIQREVPSPIFSPDAAYGKGWFYTAGSTRYLVVLVISFADGERWGICRFTILGDHADGRELQRLAMELRGEGKLPKYSLEGTTERAIWTGGGKAVAVQFDISDGSVLLQTTQLLPPL